MELDGPTGDVKDMEERGEFLKSSTVGASRFAGYEDYGIIGNMRHLTKDANKLPGARTRGERFFLSCPSRRARKTFKTGADSSGMRERFRH